MRFVMKVEMEAIYSSLELLTRDNSNVLHFINALYKFDVCYLI